MINRHSSKIFWIGISVFYLISFFQLDYWKKAAYGGDPFGYYVHLPATFIHHDVGDYAKSFEAVKKYDAGLPDPKVDKYGIRPTPSGKYAVKYSLGMAYLLSPFFLMAHIYCVSSSAFPADGFSLPYMLSLGLGVLFYVGLGLMLLVKVLRRYFTEGVVISVVLTLTLATNLLYFTVYNNLMAHAPLFAVYALLIYATDSFYQNPNRLWALLVGAAYGIIFLTRMNELYAILIPLFWNFNSLKERFSLLKSYVLWAAMPAILLFIPQVFYWHYVSGQFIYDAYVGESFNFLKSKIAGGLYGYSNGWLTWTPVMFLALLGLFSLKKQARAAYKPTIILLPLHIYVIYSWWCWQYVNGLGSRPMVEMYALLAFSLGAFYTFLKQLPIIGKALTVAILLIFSAFNIFKIYQETSGLIISAYTRRAFYWEMFTATHWSHASLVAYNGDEIQPKNPIKIKDIALLNFEDSTTINFTPLHKINGLFGFTSQEDTSVLYQTPLSKMDIRANDLVKISIHAYFEEKDRVDSQWEQTMLQVQFKTKEGKVLKSRGIAPQLFIGNKDFSIWTNGTAHLWEEVYFYVKVPPKIKSDGTMNIHLINSTRKPLYVDDLKVELWWGD